MLSGELPSFACVASFHDSRSFATFSPVNSRLVGFGVGRAGGELTVSGSKSSPSAKSVKFVEFDAFDAFDAFDEFVQSVAFTLGGSLKG